MQSAHLNTSFSCKFMTKNPGPYSLSFLVFPLVFKILNFASIILLSVCCCSFLVLLTSNWISFSDSKLQNFSPQHSFFFFFHLFIVLHTFFLQLVTTSRISLELMEIMYISLKQMLGSFNLCPCLLILRVL